MFKPIFSFELKQGFRKPSLYIYFGVFFILSLVIGLIATGYFSTTRSDSNVVVNSAGVVAGILVETSNFFSILCNVILISFMATAIQKDYEYNMHPLLFTKPISKAGYFFGRFISTYILTLFVFSAMVLGYYLGTLNGIGSSYVGEFKFINFIQPFLIFIVPNVFLLGVIFFSLSTYLRNTMVAYVVAVTIMVIQAATATISSDIENKTLAAILEPTGSTALGLLTQYWTPAEQNTKLIPFSGVLLQNRLLWMGIALIITVISYYRFRFSQFLEPAFNLFKRKVNDNSSQAIHINSLNELPIVAQTFTIKNELRQIQQLGVFEFTKMTKSLFFIVIFILSIAAIILKVRFMDSIYDSSTHLVTYKVIENAVSVVNRFIFIFILFYSGTVIWRDRTNKIDELIGSTPVSNTTLFLSKFIGLLLSFGLLLCIGSLTGIVLQLKDGFYNIDILQYIVYILRSLIVSAVLIIFCLSVQVYSTNKFIGFFIIFIPIAIIPIVFSLLQWNVFLLNFNDTGSSQPYSDMNGYGDTFIEWPIYRFYWTGIALLFTLFAFLLYARGKEKSLAGRFKLSRYFFTKKYKLLMAATVISCVAFGSYLYYEERLTEDYHTSKEYEKKEADFEKKYKKYEHLKQPRIVATTVNVDIYPKTKELHIAGVYTLKNNNAVAIDSMYIEYIGGKKSSYSYAKLNPTVGFKELMNDKEYGIKVIKLDRPLQPNDSIMFEFDMSFKPKSYFDKTRSPIEKNGTFINNQLFPGFGYNADGELTQNKARAEYGLPPKARMAKIGDSAARMNNYISKNADWIRFETTVSTDEGQTAIAPGYLQKDWKKDGRHYFTYKMDSPILNFYSFLSADYTVKRDKWNDINLEIYYQKGHEYNLDRMMKGMKKSLEYYTTNFGPYQHKQVRIIEFPRYNSFAQSFPNTIPFSESIGFIVKVDDKNPLSIDVPFYVTAHEVAHQWWAHQVIGADVQGSVLMSETMSQYSALMVMEKEYGKDAMKKFLKYEMDEYLKGRTFENKREMPLGLVENQQYIHYNKGSVVMYALKDYLGEATLNNAVKEYLNKVKFQQPPYTVASEFVKYIYDAAPDSLKYLVTDMFQYITLYENYVKKLDYKKINDKQYKVKLTLGCAKFYADDTGNLKRFPVKDYVDVGIFTTQKINNNNVEKPLLFTRVKMDAPEKDFEFTVTEKPVSAGIDPYLKLIDRTPDNNNCKFGATPIKPNLELKETKFGALVIGNDD